MEGPKVGNLSSRSSGSGEGLSKDAIGSALTEETPSWFSSGSTRRGSSGGVFSRMQSRKASPSAVVLWVNQPPSAISSYRADSLLRPNQKCCNSTWFGIDKSRLDIVRIEKWSQAAPMVSFSFYWKSRISCHREAIRDIGKNARQNMFLNSSQSPFTFPTLWVYQCFAFSSREKGNNFHRRVSCDMPKMVRHAQSCSNSYKCVSGFS